MFKQRPFAADAANATRLGRRHLADEGLVQRLVAKRHALDVEKRFVARGPHIAGIFAERTFMFDSIWRYLAFENDLSRGRYFQGDGFAWHEVDRFAAQRASNGELIECLRYFRHRHV